MAKAMAVGAQPSVAYVGIDWAYRRAAWCAMSAGGEILEGGRLGR